MNGRKWKKIITLLLVVCMLGTSLYMDHGNAKAALSSESMEGDYALSDLGSDYTVVTPEDFGITKETSYTSDTQIATTNAANWNKTVFHGRVKFTGNSGHKLFLGVNSWAGLYIYGNSDGNLHYDTNAIGGSGNAGTILASDLAKEKLTDEWLDLAISVEIKEAGASGSIRVGFFLDGKLYKNQFVTLSEINTEHFSIACRLFLSGNNGRTLGIAPLISEEPGTDITVDDLGSDYTVVKPKDFGISKETLNSGDNLLLNKTTGSWDKKVFRGRVKFTANTGNRIYFGDRAWFGLFLSGNGEQGLNYQTVAQSSDNMGAISAVDIGKESLVDTWLDLAVSIEYITAGESGSIKVGIFIDGMLCTDDFLIMENVNTGFLATANIFMTGGVSIAPLYAFPNTLRKLSLDDFGFASGTYQASGSANVDMPAPKRIESLVNTYMEMEIEKQAGNTTIQYATPNTSVWYGIRFTIYDNTIIVSAAGNLSLGSVTLDVAKCGDPDLTSFMNKKFKLGISLEAFDADEDGRDDVRMGVWINDILYQDEYIVLTDGKEKLGTGMGLIHNWPSSSDAVVTLSDPDKSSDSFEGLTLADMGNAAGVYDYATTKGFKTLYQNNKDSLDGKIFVTNVRFGSDHSQLYYGGAVNPWAALKIGNGQPADSESENVFSVSYAANGFTNDTVIDAGVAGVKLSNQTFELGISTRNVDSNGDDVFDDLEIGIWFDGKLYNNRYIYLTSYTGADSSYHKAADLLGPGLAVYNSSENGSVILGDVNATESVEHCLDRFAYFVDGDGNIMLDGRDTGATSLSITTPGKYTVQYTDKNSIFTEEILAYKTNDVTEDGKVDVRDLVALKKYADPNTERILNESGRKAIGADEETFSADEAYASIVAKLLASQNTIHAKEFSEAILGTTGSGTFITGIGVSKEGTSVISISDTEGTTYSSDVEALDGCGLDYVLDFDTERDIKVLQITDTQIIDSTQLRSGEEGTFSDELKEYYDPGNRDTVLYNELDKLVEKNKPDLILLTGDMTYGRFDDSGEAMQSLADKLDTYRIPWAPILGNHEQETAIKTEGICNILMKSDYCLFTRRHDIGGNGNYAIGIAKNGKIEKTIFMMDSNGCWSANAEDVATKLDGYRVANRRFMFQDAQIAWYRTVAENVNAHEGKKISSFMCFHVAPADIVTAMKEKGYQPSYDTSNVKYSFTLDETMSGEGDFGIKDEGATSNLKDYIYSYLKAAGTDGVFFGHQHKNALSVNWNGIRWTWGMKTGKYEEHPEQTGGTLITLEHGGAAFKVEYKVIVSENAQ